jgi:hypothetical protein
MNEYEDLLDAEGQIRRERVEDLLIEVISGKRLFAAGDTIFGTRQPRAAEVDRARVLYARRLHHAKTKGLMTRDDLEKLAIHTGQFDIAERRERETLKGHVDRLQRARDMTTSPAQKLELDAELIRIRKRLLELELKDEEVFQRSAESFAEAARTNYMVFSCTLGGELLEDPVWSTWDEFQDSTDPTFLREARQSLVKLVNGLPTKVIRALARTGDWRVRWKSVRESGSPPFEGPASGWDANKLRLIYWSDFYDSVYQHPECPAEDVIANDEYLQEWLNGQIQKRNQEKQRADRGKAPMMYTTGPNGAKKPMTYVGGKTYNVRTPVKIRTTPR